jgi:hypothetical protein
MYSVVGGVYDFHGRIGNDREASQETRLAIRVWARDLVARTMILGCDVAIAEVMPRVIDVMSWASLARGVGGTYRVIDMPCDIATAKARNTHNVPDEVIEDMAAAWEPWPEEGIER